MTEEFDWEKAEEQFRDSENASEDLAPSGPNLELLKKLVDQQEIVNENMDEFRKRFGFRYECTCAKDYNLGRLVVTTKCRSRLLELALNRAELATAEVREATAAARGLLNIVSDLKRLLIELGHGEVLHQYLQTPMGQFFKEDHEQDDA